MPASSTTSSRVTGMAPDPATTDGATMQAAGMPSLLPLVRLLQLASPALPIGAYSYSQGLERVVEDGVVHDAASARAWIGDVLELVVARGEAAIAWRLSAAAQCGDWPLFATWNAWFRASRETAELRAETEQISLGANIPAAVMTAAAIGDDDLSTFAPGLALASARHETQDTRLFRS